MIPGRALLLLLTLGLLPAAPAWSADEPSMPPAPGWAGPDLATAQALAARSERPILVLVRRPDCAACDQLEALLTEDPRIAPLTLPFVRLRVSLATPMGASTAQALQVHQVPAVLLLGPEGSEATRRDGSVERIWLTEQLQIVARRHVLERTLPDPTPAELRASLARLEEWGDREGAATLARMLLPESRETEEGNPPAGPARTAAAETLLANLTPRLAGLVDPGRIRQAAHDTALQLEAAGRPSLALQAYEQALDRLEVDPLTEARAAFLATRHGLHLEPMRRRLMEARSLEPASLPLLHALVRVAEASGRIYQAFHAAEAAAVYAPEDAWTALELRRLRLLVRLKRPQAERDPA